MGFSGITFSNKGLFPLLLFFIASFLLYIPVINNNFSCDDFRAIYRVGVNENLFVNGFFRPLSDITLYLNYRLSHLNPLPYHLTNIFIHSVCAYLLYLFCLRVAGSFLAVSDKVSFAWLASILFITYPFHNEPVAWIVGRGSSLAALFALATMLVVLGDLNDRQKFIYAGILYFSGLLAYESIFPLPGMVLFIVLKNQKSIPEFVKWLILFTGVILLHLIIRISFSGGVTGDYGQIILSLDIKDYVINLFKISGRLFLPPSDNSALLVICFIIIVVGYAALRLFKYKIKNGNKNGMNSEFRILILLCLSLIVPLTFGVSTRTSEGDRLLYFPSMFLCMFFSYLLIEKLSSKSLRGVIFSGLLIYNIGLLQINNSNWQKASHTTSLVLKEVNEIAKTKNKVWLINVPGEFNGAYILRGILEDAMLLKGIDTSGFNVVNYINNAESNLLPFPVQPRLQSDSINFSYSVGLEGDVITARDFNDLTKEPILFRVGKQDEIWYWDKKHLRRFFR